MRCWTDQKSTACAPRHHKHSSPRSGTSHPPPHVLLTMPLSLQIKQQPNNSHKSLLFYSLHPFPSSISDALASCKCQLVFAGQQSWGPKDAVWAWNSPCPGKHTVLGSCMVPSALCELLFKGCVVWNVNYDSTSSQVPFQLKSSWRYKICCRMTRQSCHSISVPFVVVFPWIGPILLGCRETNPSFVLIWSVCSRDHDPLSE